MLGVIVALTGLVLSSAACDYTTGPSLTVDVMTPDGDTIPPATPVLEPSNEFDDPGICCCRVVGRIMNQSAVGVHATLKFEAFETGVEDPVGTALDFLGSMTPGEERPYTAAGFVQACDEFDRVELADVDLRGLDASP